MKVKTHIKSGGQSWNHNEKQIVGTPAPTKPEASTGMKITTRIKAGGQSWNHNEKQLASQNHSEK